MRTGDRLGCHALLRTDWQVVVRMIRPHRYTVLRPGRSRAWLVVCLPGSRLLLEQYLVAPGTPPVS